MNKKTLLWLTFSVVLIVFGSLQFIPGEPVSIAATDKTAGDIKPRIISEPDVSE
jgi:hypothetical protein